MKIGEKIAFYRKKANMTQEELAYEMEVSRQSVYKWEHNVALPELGKIQKLITILNITYEELLTMEEKKDE